MMEHPVTAGVARGKLNFPPKFIVDELAAAALRGIPVRPGIVVHAAQDYRIEAGGTSGAQQRKIELRGPPEILEEHPERVLGGAGVARRRVAARAAFNAHATVDLKAGRDIRLDILTR